MIYLQYFASIYLKSFFIKVTDDACPLNREVVRELRIEVLPSPVFTLGQDFVFPCDEKVIITPSSTADITSYQWMQWAIEEDSVFIVDTLLNVSSNLQLLEHKHIALLAENTSGCHAIDSVKIFPSIEAEVSLQNWCYGDSTVFLVEASTSFDEITEYHWNYGNGEFATNRANLHQKLYTAPDVYEVEVVVVDDRSCRDTLSIEVDLCEAPNFNFVVADSCNNTATVLDFTDYSGSCGLARMQLSNGRYETQIRDTNYKIL